MITGHDPKFIAIRGRAARLSCFFVRGQLAAASLLGEDLLKFILAATDCPPMVDSFLTPVMRRPCSFFKGLCYMILRILSYGRSIFTHLANSYANFTAAKESFYWNTYGGCRFGASIWPWGHMKTLFTHKWLMHCRICKNQLLRSDITKTRRDHNIPINHFSCSTIKMQLMKVSV